MNMTVSAKVLHVDQPIQVSANLTKQDVIIADATASAKITLWEDNLNTLDEGHAVLQIYKCDCQMLQTGEIPLHPQERAEITLIQDLENVADDVPNNTINIFNAKVVAATLTVYSTCIACKSKLELTDSDITCCKKCQMSQLNSAMSTEVSAVLYITTDDIPIHLSAFQNVFSKIVRGQELAVPHLLAAPPFNWRMVSSLELTFKSQTHHWSKILLLNSSVQLW